jgi:hypothetical protein
MRKIKGSDPGAIARKELNERLERIAEIEREYRAGVGKRPEAELDQLAAERRKLLTEAEQFRKALMTDGIKGK